MSDEVQAAAEAAPEVVQTAETETVAPEAAESTEGQVETPPAEGEAPEEKNSASKERRMRRKAAIERIKAEARDARAELARAQREIERLKGAEQTQPPKIEDYDDHDAYLADRTAYAAMQQMDARQVAELERQEAEAKQRAQQLYDQQRREAIVNWAAQAEEARAKYADFDEVVQAEDLRITEDMVALMGMSENGADIAYYLGTNPQQAAELASLPAAELVGAFRVLDRMISVQTPRPRTETKAPEPVTPVKPKATATKRVEDMTMAEYRAAREAGKI